MPSLSIGSASEPGGEGLLHFKLLLGGKIVITIFYLMIVHQIVACRPAPDQLSCDNTPPDHPWSPGYKYIHVQKRASQWDALFSAKTAAKLLARVFLAELVNTTCGIKNLLLTGVERMAS